MYIWVQSAVVVLVKSSNQGATASSKTLRKNDVHVRQKLRTSS